MKHKKIFNFIAKLFFGIVIFGGIYFTQPKSPIHVSAALPPTASCSVSPNPLPNGGNPGITLNSTNGYYCYVAHDWINVSNGYFTSGTFYPGAQTTPGTHEGEVHCYNSDWVLSPWSSCSYTVNNPIPFDFSLSNSGTVTIARSDNTSTFYGTNTVTVTLTAGVTQQVYTGLSQLPAGVGGTIYRCSPNSPTCTNDITYTVYPSAVAGTYPMTVQIYNIDSSVSKFTTYNLVIVPPIINGGWSAWSAKNTTPGYSGSQTRTCTNPTPSGGGADCSGVFSQPYTNSPSTPTGFYAGPSSCGNNWMNLSWDFSPGATNYKVYRSGVLVYNNSGSAFSDTGLTLGASYSYTITASNDGGTSGPGATSGTVAVACTCPNPLTQNVAVACDLNASGASAVSGAVTRSQTKSAYPSCAFPTPVTSANSTYVSDNCVYPVFDYSLSNSGPTTITKGGIPTYGQNTVTKTISTGPTQSVDLTVSGLPAGVTSAVGNPVCSPTCSSTITFTVQPSTSAGTYPITVTSSPLNKTTTFNLIINNSPNIISTCTPSNSTPLVGTQVTWTAAISGGVPPYTFTWSGTNIPTGALTPSSTPYSITYSTVGTKTTLVNIKDSLQNSGSCPQNNVQVKFNPKSKEI